MGSRGWSIQVFLCLGAQRRQVGEGAGGETGADEAECRVAALGAGIARTGGKNLLRGLRAGHLGPPRGALRDLGELAPPWGREELPKSFRAVLGGVPPPHRAQP